MQGDDLFDVLFVGQIVMSSAEQRCLVISICDPEEHGSIPLLLAELGEGDQANMLKSKARANFKIVSSTECTLQFDQGDPCQTKHYSRGYLKRLAKWFTSLEEVEHVPD